MTLSFATQRQARAVLEGPIAAHLFAYFGGASAPLKPSVGLDRYKKDIHDKDSGRATAGYQKAALGGGLIGAFKRAKGVSRGRGALIGAGIGVGAQAAVRAATGLTKDQYGDRSYTGKGTDRVVPSAALAGAGLMVLNKLHPIKMRVPFKFAARLRPTRFSAAQAALGAGASRAANLARFKKALVPGAALAGAITVGDVTTSTAMPEHGETRGQAAWKGLKKGAIYGTALAGSEPFLEKGLRGIAKLRLAARLRPTLFGNMVGSERRSRAEYKQEVLDDIAEKENDPAWQARNRRQKQVGAAVGGAGLAGLAHFRILNRADALATMPGMGNASAGARYRASAGMYGREAGAAIKRVASRLHFAGRLASVTYFERPGEARRRTLREEAAYIESDAVRKGMVGGAGLGALAAGRRIVQVKRATGMKLAPGAAAKGIGATGLKGALVGSVLGQAYGLFNKRSRDIRHEYYHPPKRNATMGATLAAARLRPVLFAEKRNRSTPLWRNIKEDAINTGKNVGAGALIGGSLGAAAGTGLLAKNLAQGGINGLAKRTMVKEAWARTPKRFTRAALVGGALGTATGIVAGDLRARYGTRGQKIAADYNRMRPF